MDRLVLGLKDKTLKVMKGNYLTSQKKAIINQKPL